MWISDNVLTTGISENVAHSQEKSNVCPADNEPLVRFGDGAGFACVALNASL
jgi:hypothetical protein